MAKNVHPDYPLIIAANRDEYFSRPTQAPTWWPEAPHLFAGKDLQAGGTWLGHNKKNRVAGITNLRCPELHLTGAKSRGDLVKRFLDIDTDNTEVAMAEFTAFLTASYDQYNPFNIVFGDVNTLMVFSSATGVAQVLGDGVHSLSNGLPNNIWPKMHRGIDKLSVYLNTERTLNAEPIFSLLRDETLAPATGLPKTGISSDTERLLSSIFIPECRLNNQRYGTRSSSIIWLDKHPLNAGVVMQSLIHNK